MYICCCWVIKLCPTVCDPWTSALLSFTISQSSLKVVSIESVMPSNHLILCHPFLLLPSISPGIRIFSSESAFCIRWPKYSSWSFSISPSNEYPGLISFRIDWFDLVAVQGILKSLLQYHSSNTLVKIQNNPPPSMDNCLPGLHVYHPSPDLSLYFHACKCDLQQVWVVLFWIF